MLPLYTNPRFIADQSDYGDYTLIYTFLAFMNLFYLYGMDAAFLRYSYVREYKREDVYKTAFLTIGCTAVVLSALIYFASPSVSLLLFGPGEYIFFVKAAALILLFDTFSNLPYLILRVEEKSITYSTIRVIRFVLELILNVFFLVFLKMGVKGILYANIIAAIINIIILLPYQTRYFKGRFDKTVLKQLLLFGLPLIPNSLAYMVVEVSDKYLMRLLLDKETLGIYSANYKFGSILLFLVIAFRTAWQPFFLKVSSSPDARKIYSKVLTYFILIGVGIIISVSYLIEYIVKIPLPGSMTLLGSDYFSGLQIIPVILSAYLFYGIYVNFTVGIYINKKTKLMIIFTGLAAVINVGSNFYLMPAFGIMGAATATLLSYLVMALSIFIANQKIYPIQYEYNRITFLMIVLAGMLFILYYFEPHLLMRIVLLLVLPVVFMISGFIKRDEIQAVRSLLKRQ